MQAIEGNTIVYNILLRCDVACVFVCFCCAYAVQRFPEPLLAVFVEACDRCSCDVCITSRSSRTPAVVCCGVFVSKTFCSNC